MAIRIGFVALVLCLAACNGDEPPPSSTQAGSAQGRWIGTGGPCEDLDMLQQNDEARENIGFVTCSNAGLTFSGDLRCERDYIEVMCR